MAENLQPKSPGLLGQTLKQLRETKKESLAEAAGAVEIEEQHLEAIEAGRELPSEDVLHLLFSHFRVDGPNAARLRQLAGYDDEIEMPGMVKLPVVVLGIDQRVIYSDGVHIDIGPNGVVMNFTQSAAGPDQPRVAVSRVGMSPAQAEAVIKTMEQALLHAKYNTGPKALPPASQQNTSENN